jgi:3',5'-cyclic AMP phosphodiesterase CpdA
MAKIILAHISDLHFDSRILNDRFIGVPHRLGHDKVLSFALMTALEEVPSDCQVQVQGPIDVVVSGDLTRVGDESEFAVAHTLLLSAARLQLIDPNDLLGYKIAADRFASVPGNHDQYGARGWPMPAYNPALRGVHFEDTPWHHTITEASGHLILDLFGVDTNSGRLPGFGLNILAWGDISRQQLIDLERLLTRAPAVSAGQRMRALVMHHSLSYRGGAGAIIGLAALSPRSRREIRRICAEYGMLREMDF